MPILQFDAPIGNGGGGGGGGRKRRTRFLAKAKLANDHLFFVLPAPTREEIAKRLHVRTGSPWSIGMVDSLLAFTRDNVLALGWMVTMAKAAPNPSLSDRFFQALLNADGTYWSDYQHVTVLESLAYWLARCIKNLQRQKYMLLAQANHTLDPVEAGLLRLNALQIDLALKTAENLRDYYRKKGF